MIHPLKDRIAIRERYLRDNLTIRIGGLAANLARVKSFSNDYRHRDIVESLVEESKFFIEWAAPDAGPDLGSTLAELQLQLARWQLAWHTIWEDTAHRDRVGNEAQAWSTELLRLAGLLR